MDYTQKIKLLNELMLNATPQNVDFTPQNGNYCVTLIATRPVHTWGYQKRNFKIKGRLEEGKTISADLIAENEMLLEWKICLTWHTRVTVPLSSRLFVLLFSALMRACSLRTCIGECGRLLGQIILSKNRIRKNRQKRKSDS